MIRTLSQKKQLSSVVRFSRKNHTFLCNPKLNTHTQKNSPSSSPFYPRPTFIYRFYTTENPSPLNQLNSTNQTQNITENEETLLQREEHIANENLSDPNIQLSFLKKLNQTGRGRYVIDRFKSVYLLNKVKLTTPMVNELIKAAVKEDSLSEIPSSAILSFRENSNSNLNLNGLSATSSSQGSSHTPDRLWVKILRWDSVIFLVIYFLVFPIAILYFYASDKISSIPEGKIHHQAQDIQVSFNDVKGMQNVKEQFKEIVSFLKEPSKFEEIGAKLPKGVLLIGPPGTGKTLMARAVAKEAGVPFYYASAGEFEELYVGVGNKRVRSLFEEAKKNSPSIVFIDEIDAIGTSRSFHKLTYNGTINQLLVEMDGFDKSSHVIVIGATNVADQLDPALVRPGRFDKKIYVSPPDIKERQEILEFYLSKVVLDENISTINLARATTGFVGADLENLVNVAAIKAARTRKPKVTLTDLEEALDDIVIGVKASRPPSDHQKKLVSYHEGGHAIVTLCTGRPLHKVTIIPRGSAGGVTFGFESEELSMSFSEVLDQICITLGGRIAEEMIFGYDKTTNGPSSDLKQATKLATHLVTQLGFSKEIGNVSLSDQLAAQQPSLSSFSATPTISAESKALVEQEIQAILEQQYQKTCEMLKSKEKELHILAEALIQHETLTADEVSDIVFKKVQINTSSIGKKVSVVPSTASPSSFHHSAHFDSSTLSNIPLPHSLAVPSTPYD